MKDMYYCIHCSEIHHERSLTDRVFKNGFYIDPFLGERYHLGMCKDATTGEKVLSTKENLAPQSIMNALPIHIIST
ncbi:hypothetical protein COL30_04910 [Bacillus pseudomycoides]|uniref:Uncharacterized protein n=2 Tax=Bacillus pseudomycoides TaxID=64104 RepID=A0A2B6R6J6_9BACI|nr:hypothetical protein CON79_06330 [Bacillus pseudomycoides]PEA81438.1 hypothetical protein CON99_22555 [Bacillus pseudomycoides]PED06531.1 hypothetical protein COO19_20415 [Bacillus pseudomycoides]PED72521.1 hypothetical protein CON97_08215 [Bacillus pseudomycoides]PEI41629.1 hypothetical protein CN620_11915 [Bacillus pseudomycoides]